MITQQESHPETDLISLRDYQIECVQTVLDEFAAGVSRQILSLPTGSGKTILMAALAKRLNKKTLILAHREELVQQGYEKIKFFWPQANVGICMADRNEIEAQIVVGSVQSCSRPKRLEALKAQGFEVLFVDECHHAISESYQSVIKSLGFDNDKRKLLLGVSATIERADKQGLGNTFEKVTFARSIGTMIKCQYLTPVIGRKILTSFVMKKINIVDGDFSIDSLTEAINTEERNAFVAQKYLEYAKERKGVVFCSSVDHCHDMAKAFNSLGIATAAVWGDMGSDSRKKTLESLKKGEIQVATSCGVLVEGWDEATISCIVMARPTRSKALYVQCVGRGLRLWPGKQNCLVLDFSDRGHNLDSVMTLSSTIPEAYQIEEEVEAVERDEIDRTAKIQVLYECDKEFDILGGARFMWVDVGDGEWSLIDDDKREIVMRPFESGYIADLFLPDGSSKQIITTPIPLEYCSGCCEDFARRHLKIAFADMGADWMHRKAFATQSQREYLQKKGLYCEGMSKQQAAFEIRNIVAKKNKQRRKMGAEPITNSQKYFLKQHGVDPTGMSKQAAMYAIAGIKKKENNVPF